MPAATPKKSVHQHANKLQRKDTESTTTSLDIPPPQTAETMSEPAEPPAISTPAETSAPTTATSSTWLTPAPATFTISYIPLAISYPEPPDPATKLPTDAVRITRAELALLLHQSYVHGSEHGWKTHFISAKDTFQVAYEQDMVAAAIKFAEHEKQLYEEAYNCGFEHATDGWETQLTSLQDSQEARIQEERQRWESSRASQVDASIQVSETIRIFSEASSQVMCTPIAAISLPIPLSPSPLSSPITEPLEPVPFIWSDEPSNITVHSPLLLNSLSAPPIITSFPSHDFLDLQTGSNPWWSLQHHKGRGRHRSTPFLPQCQRPLLNFYSYFNRSPSYIPKANLSPIHHQSPPALPAPQAKTPLPPPVLDWDHDPHLSELSCILRTLGWVFLVTQRP
ncbi:hypothetical protein CPB84DRAFT_1854983 [Gymnopilus junonius]|uniref:Uncharacterized protein n=1 Tax=Gymnopilus junonius TaxID=109634 RepID=A0A9P5N8S8_GYMJU|nr:hypothetical protein CPB84DRAFT_1854983 [Gymnopilus junonius]